MVQAMLEFPNYSEQQNQTPSKLEQEKKDLQTLMNTFTEETESQQDLYFSTDYNDVQPKKQRKEKSYYSSTKVKARNLLTYVSYRRFKQSDFENLSFLTDILSF